MSEGSLGFTLVAGETAHVLATGETVVVRLTGHEVPADAGVVVVQVDADVVDPTSGETLVDLPPHQVTFPLDVAADRTAFGRHLDRARAGAVERARTKLIALAALASLPRTPEPGKSARRLARQAPPL